MIDWNLVNRIATALEKIAAAVEVRTAPPHDYSKDLLAWHGPQECVYCGARNVPIATRGSLVIGCSRCLKEHVTNEPLA